MNWFIEANKTLDQATDPDRLVDRMPQMRESLEAVTDLRQFYRETGIEGNIGGGWKHIASVRAPVLSLAEILDPQFLNGNGKKNLYRWLDNHPGYVTYDRRAALNRRPFFGWRPEGESNGAPQD